MATPLFQFKADPRNVTSPVITLTGPTLLNSLVTPMVVTTEYLPVTIGGAQYYLLLSQVA